MMTERSSESPTAAASPPVGAPPDAALVPGGQRTWQWRWEHRPTDAQPAVEDPQTFYELFSGRPDPNRERFILARRALDVLTWALIIGIPIALIVLALATGQPAENAFYFGIFGLIVGAMIRKSIPRPFG
jgi:hypothetical protein